MLTHNEDSKTSPFITPVYPVPFYRTFRRVVTPTSSLSSLSSRRVSHQWHRQSIRSVYIVDWNRTSAGVLWHLWGHDPSYTDSKERIPFGTKEVHSLNSLTIELKEERPSVMDTSTWKTSQEDGGKEVKVSVEDSSRGDIGQSLTEGDTSDQESLTSRWHSGERVLSQWWLSGDNEYPSSTKSKIFLQVSPHIRRKIQDSDRGLEYWDTSQKKDERLTCLRSTLIRDRLVSQSTRKRWKERLR